MGAGGRSFTLAPGRGVRARAGGVRARGGFAHTKMSGDGVQWWQGVSHGEGVTAALCLPWVSPLPLGPVPPPRS